MKSFKCLWAGSEVIATLDDDGLWHAPIVLVDSLRNQFGPNFKVLDLDGDKPTERLATADERFAAACTRMGGTVVEDVTEPGKHPELIAVWEDDGGIPSQEV